MCADRGCNSRREITYTVYRYVCVVTGGGALYVGVVLSVGLELEVERERELERGEIS